MTVNECDIRQFAELCTEDMGDVFWDRDTYDPDGAEYADPREVAAETIRVRLAAFLRQQGVVVPSET